MCGIIGFIDRAIQYPEQILKRMTDAITHRGPDDEGIWHDRYTGVGLGHRRLSILDLSPAGHQPMISQCGRYVIVFNGEIYNFRTIRKKIQKEFDGTIWHSSSDTEVVLQAIVLWGLPKALKEFVGMYAFAILDRADEALYLVRDRMGEKPLYYGWSSKVFLFGSELKPLCFHPSWRGEIDKDVLGLYFRNNYVPSPFSIYKNIFKLPPGTFLRITLNNISPGQLPEPIHYWSLLEVADNGIRNPFPGTDQEAISELDTYLKEAISGQMISDVPLGAFLSGGVDSSAIVALMQSQSPKPIRTFTIGFHDIAYNEANHANSVAQYVGTDHTESYVTPEECMAVIPELPRLYDEPFADSSQIPTYLVCKLARQSVTVSLSGDGGDEVFLGYNRHVQLDRLQMLFKNIPLSVRKLISRGLNTLPASLMELILRKKKYGILADQVQKIADILTRSDPVEMYQILTKFWEYPSKIVLGSNEKQSLLTDKTIWPDFANLLHRIMYIEQMTSLPDDMLVKVDRAAMGLGLETRVPLLDHRLVEFSWRLPLRMKYRDGLSKWILRQILYKYVPNSLIERPKSGFSIPIDIWLKGPLRDWAEELLNENRLKNEGYLNSNMVRSKWAEHIEGKKKWHPHLWGVLMFQAWLDNL
jgi:asparagine synthase (glutamine-hydrolysing)